MYCAFSDIRNIYHFKVTKLFEYFDNQEYTTPTQSTRKKCNPAFLGNKNFIKDKNGNRPLYKDIGRVMIKILHSLNVPSKMRQKAKYKYEHIHIHASLYTSFCPSAANLMS